MEAQEHDTISAEDLREALSVVLKEDGVNVIAITGAWGGGKTHFWKNYAGSMEFKLLEHETTYISLFGKSSIDDLELAMIADLATKEEFKSSKVGRYYSNFQSLLSVLDPKLKHLVIAAQQVWISTLKQKIICLDDIERTKIPMDELMGFISRLSEEQSNKFVLIMNDNELAINQRNTFLSFNEKVIDYSFRFFCSHQDAIEIVFNHDRGELSALNQQNINAISNYTEILKITNIRVLKKIKANILSFKNAWPDIKPNDYQIDNFTKSFILLVWVHFEKKQTLEFVKGMYRNRYGLIRFMSDMEAPISPKAKHIAEKMLNSEYLEFYETYNSILSEYGYDRIDLVHDNNNQMITFEAAYVQLAYGYIPKQLYEDTLSQLEERQRT